MGTGISGTGIAATGIVVVGGGLAGGAAACRLAQAGCPVRLFERETRPVDKICGEFLSNGAQLHLRRLGLDPAALGGQPIERLRLVRGDRVVESALPFQALGLSRRVLDEALLRHAAGCGAEIARGRTVSLVAGDRLALDTGAGLLHPETLFLASGKHDLRGIRRAAEAPEQLVGFKTYFALAPAQQRALEGHIEVILLPDGYAGLQLVEGGRANLCLLTRRSRLHRAGGTWAGLLAGLTGEVGHLRRRLEGADDMLERPLTIFRVPYGFVHRAQPGDRPEVFRLGDQMAVIPSFAGDGMAIALHSAAVAAAAHLAGETSAAFHRRITADIARQIRGTHALYRFARWLPGQALLMGAARLWPGLLRQAAALSRVPPAALRRATG